MIYNVICEITPIPSEKLILKEGWGKCFVSQSLPIAVSHYWTSCRKVMLSLKPCWCELLQNGLYGCRWTSHQNTTGSKEQQYVVRGNIWKHITCWWAPETHGSATPARSGRSPRACWAQVQPAASSDRAAWARPHLRWQRWLCAHSGPWGQGERINKCTLGTVICFY